MSQPEDPASRNPPRAVRGKSARAAAQKRKSKQGARPNPAPLDSDFGVAMLVCCNDEIPHDS